MNTGSSPPPKPRYGSHTNEDRAELTVRITSADFNGSSFDGSPFSVRPDWLLDALKDERITISDKHGDCDYAVWKVETKKGPVYALPGDRIIRREHGDLSVVEEEDAFILINLRPPVEDLEERRIMIAIYLSDDPTNPIFEHIKYKIGDRLRITQAKGADNYPDDTRDVLKASVGNVYPIDEISAWNSGDEENPSWIISYEFRVTKEDLIVMDEDEVEQE